MRWGEEEQPHRPGVDLGGWACWAWLTGGTWVSITVAALVDLGGS